MPYFDIQYRVPVVQPSIPQDKVEETPWRLIKRWEGQTPEGAMREFKELKRDFSGVEPEIKSICESAELTALEELGAFL
jgi:hypothetical protein